MNEHPEGVEELVDALLEGYAPISVILDHMFQAPGHATVGEVRELLGDLLRDTFEPLAMRYGPDELRTTAAIVQATVPLIHENLMVVPHAPPRPTRTRQRRGGRTSSRRP
jgi:hypothetical protein